MDLGFFFVFFLGGGGFLDCSSFFSDVPLDPQLP